MTKHLTGQPTRSEILSEVSEWNRTRSEYPREKCIHQLFEREAELRPEAVALECEGEEVSYGEVEGRANQLARRLHSQGVGPEVAVGVLLERSTELVVALLAVLKAGGAYVPLDGSYPPARLAWMVKDTGLRTVVTRGALAGQVPEGCQAVLVDGEEGEQIGRLERTRVGSSAGPDNLAYVIYTSGSTGSPKGVMVSHGNVVRLVKGIKYVELNAGETMLQFAPVSFDASTFEIWGALLNGARLIIAPAGMLSPAELARIVKDNRITTLWLTAGLFHLMVDEQAEALAQVRQLLAGGDVLWEPQVRKLLQIKQRGVLINGYGPTESTTFTCTHAMSEAAEVGDSVLIGRPISNTQVYLLGPGLEPQPVGVAGELYIGGEGLARGYLGRPELTAERFIPNPFGEPGTRLYRTGDRARYLQDGSIDFLGRLDQQIKIRGFRIELGEVEAAVAAVDGVREAVVVAQDGPGVGGRRLVAYVVAAAEVTPGEIRAQLRERLPEYMVPANVVMLDELPLTANGKVDREALPKATAQAPTTASIAREPRTEVEQALAAIWREVLGLQRVGVQQNFFDLGGHSLLAGRILYRVREVFRVDLPLRSLFETPTIEGFAESIEERLIEELENVTDKQAREWLEN
jgi:amino acid adenylation domain-containing protein